MKEAYKDPPKVNLIIIPHPSDKQFPEAAILRIVYKGKLWEYAIGLDGIYKEGDTGLEMRHLEKLFREMAEMIRYDGYDLSRKEE